jgi:hypothetical protein
MQWEKYGETLRQGFDKAFWPIAHSSRKFVENWRPTLTRPKRTRIQKDPDEEKSLGHGWQRGREKNLANHAQLLPVL